MKHKKMVAEEDNTCQSNVQWYSLGTHSSTFTVFSADISLGELNTLFIKLARVVHMNKRNLQNLDFAIGLRMAEEMCLDQSIGIKRRLIEDLDNQLKYQEKERGAKRVNALSREIGDPYLGTDEVENTLEQAQSRVEEMEPEVSSLKEIVEKLAEDRETFL
jgi:chromosome segregation ATPase